MAVADRSANAAVESALVDSAMAARVVVTSCFLIIERIQCSVYCIELVPTQKRNALQTKNMRIIFSADIVP